MVLNIYNAILLKVLAVEVSFCSFFTEETYMMFFFFFFTPFWNRKVKRLNSEECFRSVIWLSLAGYGGA